MNIYQWIAFLLSLAPKIIELIQIIEQQIGAGHGDLKKDSVLDSVTLAASAAGATSNQIAVVQSISDGFIDRQVSRMNSSGVFKTSGIQKL